MIEYKLKGEKITKNGHTMFLEDIVSDLNRGAYLEDEKVKTLPLLNVSNSLETKIYVTNSSPYDVYAAFDSKNRCEIEVEESGCSMTEITLYKGKRL